MFIRTPVTGAQRQRIEVGLTYPDEFRDVRVLVTDDNLVTYGWISTRRELDPGQLRRYKPASKKSEPASGMPFFEAEEGVAAHLKKSASSGLLKRKKAASSSKRPTSPKSAAGPALPAADETEA